MKCLIFNNITLFFEFLSDSKNHMVLYHKNIFNDQLDYFLADVLVRYSLTSCNKEMGAKMQWLKQDKIFFLSHVMVMSSLESVGYFLCSMMFFRNKVPQVSLLSHSLQCCPWLSGWSQFISTLITYQTVGNGKYKKDEHSIILLHRKPNFGGLKW